MAIFPGAISSFAGFTSSHTLSTDNHASQHNSEQAEIVAVQTKVGTGSSTPAASQVLRGTGTGTSGWGQIALTTDVTGVLPVANGGTAVTTTTGTAGKLVYDTSPTLITPILTTPVITDHTNATHTHASNAQGGLLNGANAITANTINFANLLSTIFSGQITTYATGGSFYYLNLGGIKIFYGTANSISIAGGAGAVTSGTVIFPVGFFSAINSALVVAIPGTDARAICNVNAVSTVQLDIYAHNTGGVASTVIPNVLVIGS